MFEIVYDDNGRRLDGYTISSPCEPNGSGDELKMNKDAKKIEFPKDVPQHTDFLKYAP